MKEEKKQPHPLRRYLISGAIGLVLAFLIMWARGLFQTISKLERYRIMSDGFFVTGILMAGFGCLIYVSQNGAFDAIRFSIQSFFSFLRSKETRDKYVSYADYTASLAEKRTISCGFLIIPGLVLLAAAFICVLQFMKLDI